MARDLLLAKAKQDLAAGVEDVSDAMNQAGWKTVALGLLAAAVPVATSATTADVVSLAGVLPGLGAAAYGAKSSHGAYKQALGKPLAYAALARAEFGKRPSGGGVRLRHRHVWPFHIKPAPGTYR